MGPGCLSILLRRARSAPPADLARKGHRQPAGRARGRVRGHILIATVTVSPAVTQKGAEFRGAVVEADAGAAEPAPPARCTRGTGWPAEMSAGGCPTP